MRLYDPTPWRRVYDEDHDFGSNNGPVVQGNFIKFQVIGGSQLGLWCWFWDNALGDWYRAMDLIFVTHAGVQALEYPRTLRVKHNSPEKVVLVVRMHDDATDDLDTYADIELTFLRGKRYFCG